MRRSELRPDRTRPCAGRGFLRRSGTGLIGIAVLHALIGIAGAVHPSALDSVASALRDRSFRLKVDLHEPDPAADSMIAPTLEARGWHHHNPGRPVAIRAGSLVKVTGVFNHSERGLFVELTDESAGDRGEQGGKKPSMRIRIVVEKPPEDPAAQSAEALRLIALALETMSDSSS